MVIFARVAMISQLMPGIGAQTIPTNIRLAVALLVTVLLVPVVQDKIPDIPASVFGLVFLIIGEIIVGFFIGGTAVMLTSALDTAGASIAFQTSLSSAQNTDLSTAVQGTLVSSFLSIISITLIFAMDVHHIMLGAMYDSYVMFTPGSLLPAGDAAQAAVSAFANAFFLGVQLSAPFIIVGFVFNVGIGILSRLMPQLQFLLVLLPANIMVGFFLMFALIGTMMMWYIDHLQTGLAIFLVK